MSTEDLAGSIAGSRAALTPAAEAEATHNNFTPLRLALALLVVFGHFKLLSGTVQPAFPFNLADAAVYSFFVVSGFLIAGSYERSSTLRGYLFRRVFRLYPMYACVVLAQAVLLAIASTQVNGFGATVAPALRYLGVNLVFANFLQYDVGGVLDHLRVPGLNPSLWTLKIEIGFYFVAPFICEAKRRWGWPVLATLFLASAVYAVGFGYFDEVRLAKQLPGQLQFFIVGMALHYYGARWRPGFALALAVAVGFPVVWTFVPQPPPLVLPLMVGLFVAAVALWSPPLGVGLDISYSVYLLHGPVLQTLLWQHWFVDSPWLLASVVTGVIAVSLVTERLIERPGTALGRRLSRRAPRPAMLTTKVAGSSSIAGNSKAA
jgi:peptidoglycan/LPS O-acetylase OafA/YrhL